jgi:hypothetical protein
MPSQRRRRAALAEGTTDAEEARTLLDMILHEETVVRIRNVFAATTVEALRSYMAMIDEKVTKYLRVCMFLYFLT